MATLVENMVDFGVKLNFERLPAEVAHEMKRTLLDSIGCALGGLSIEKGEQAAQLARDMGGPPEARVIGTGDRVSAFAAVFANGELINALDYDAIISPPGHVQPYVIPVPLALAEKEGASGKSLVCALAAAHEVSARFGRAMADARDVGPDGKISFPSVTGYSSTVFGGALAAGMILGLDTEKMAYALGIAGHIAPAQSMTKWAKTLPPTSDKYLLAGWICQAELLAVLLAEHGYTGDIEVLEGDYGFWRYMGSARWTPEFFDSLGEEWWIPRTTVYKPFPCCGMTQTVLDCLYHIVEENQLQPEEIERVDTYLDPHGAVLPMWQNKEVASALEAQMSVPYAVSLAVHHVKIGPEWQDLDTINDKRIISFMDKVSAAPHPEYEKMILEDPASRVGKVDVVARGRIFSEERRYRIGSPATEETRMTDGELVDKFKRNAARVLPSEKIEKLSDMILRLEDIDNVSYLARMW